MPMQEKVQKYFAGCVGPTIRVTHKIQDHIFQCPELFNFAIFLLCVLLKTLYRTL